MKEHWSGLYDNLSVHAIGEYDLDEWEKICSAADRVGNTIDARLVAILHEDDLVELGVNLQNRVNATRHDQPYFMIGGWIGVDEVALLYKLARQYKDVEFLQGLAYDCVTARKIWKGKK
jgi:hypothetical protein